MGDKLTTSFVRTVQANADRRLEFWDNSPVGLGLRVSPSGRKTWVVVYRFERRQRRYTIGTYPVVELSEARKKATDILKSVALGEDPASEKASARIGLTFQELATDYIERYAKKKKKSWKKDQAVIQKDLLGAWGSLKADSITRRDVNGILDRIESRGASIQANRTLEVVRKMFNWAIGESRVDLEINPCMFVKKRGQEKPRQRVLGNQEIGIFWEATDWEKYSEAIRARGLKLRQDAIRTRIALRMILLTGQRPGEVAEAAWTEFDDDWETSPNAFWTIPQTRSKNGRQQRVPITNLVRDHLRVAKASGDGARWVFPSPRSEGPITAGSLPSAVKKANHYTLEPFTPHDLRRTIATHLEGPGCDVPRFVVERVLNHKDTSVTGRHYALYNYDAEKRSALEAWERNLNRILTG